MQRSPGCGALWPRTGPTCVSAPALNKNGWFRTNAGQESLRRLVVSSLGAGQCGFGWNQFTTKGLRKNGSGEGVCAVGGGCRAPRGFVGKNERDPGKALPGAVRLGQQSLDRFYNGCLLG